jgi:hypothetical protein
MVPDGADDLRRGTVRTGRLFLSAGVHCHKQCKLEMLEV